MKKTKVEVEKLKNDILEVALDIFLTKNYSETNIKDITDRLGTTRTPVYYHFRNKYEIYVQVVENYLAEKIETFREILLNDADFFIKIEKDLHVCTQQAVSENVIFSEITTNPELSGILQRRKETFDTIYGYKLLAVEEAKKKGQLRKDVDSYEIVDHLYLLHFGLLEMSQCNYHCFSPERMEKLVKKQAETIKSLYAAFRLK